MVDREKLKRILNNYRSYRYAISNGVAPFTSDNMIGMPRGMGYGSRRPVLSSGSTISSELDYQQYSFIVRAIDGAVNDVLSDNERFIIMGKYLERNKQTLYQLAIIKDIDESTARRWHKEALRKLSIALDFVQEPEIINIDDLIKKVS